MNVAGLIARFSTGTYTVTRTANVDPVRGRVGTGTQTTFTITASVSPLTGDDLQKLPEGRRAENTQVVFTATALVVGGQGNAYQADSVSINGEDWTVINVERWQDPHTGNVGYKCLVHDDRQ